MFDITTIGELFVDFVPCKIEGMKDVFKKCAGGATANVTVAASKLGLSNAFIGQVGDDSFGRFLCEEMEQNNVNTKGIVIDEKHSTPLSIVSLDKDGNRSFEFYHNDTADMYIDFKYLPLKLIDECRMFHFGALTLSSEVSADATINCVKYAKEHGKMISYDPNYRKYIWCDKEKAIEKMKSVLQYCDIIKLSDEEFQMVTDSEYMLTGIAELLNQNIKIILVSQGANGCILATRKGIKQLSTYNVSDVVDTTGSGDSFVGAFLYKILSNQKSIEDYSFEELCEFADFANASGSLCATNYGAIPSMPTLEQIDECRKTTQRFK